MMFSLPQVEYVAPKFFMKRTRRTNIVVKCSDLFYKMFALNREIRQTRFPLKHHKNIAYSTLYFEFWGLHIQLGLSNLQYPNPIQQESKAQNKVNPNQAQMLNSSLIFG